MKERVALISVLVTAAGAAGALWLGRSPLEVVIAAGLAGLAAVAFSRWVHPVEEQSDEPAMSGFKARLTPAPGYAGIVHMLAEVHPDALMLFSDDGVIRYANPAARDLFFSGDDPANQNFFGIIRAAPPPLREALLGESDRLFSVEIDGQNETYHLTRRSFEIANELCTLLLVKHLTLEVRRREVDVLKKVVRVMSHEVNNSLAPVVSLVHSARLIAAHPEQLDKLTKVFDTIEERAKHLHSFIGGYAGMARLPKPQPRPIEWVPLFDHVRVLYPAVKLPDPPEKPGWFDPVQVEQILINLLKNANESGCATEDIELTVAMDPDGATRFEILDRGPGFSEEALANAILPFYTTKEKGSGVGLALCREIVDAHGGGLSLANREGGGAVVRVMLPGKRAPDPALSRSRAKLTLSRS
jgi:two-component system, NtrC family, nitrogen regulation sensor histidine kinase NtrY